jgi:hypothetical protein
MRTAFLTTSALLGYAAFAAAADSHADFEKTLKPLLTKYCVDCHGGKKVKGKVDFTKVKTATDIADAFKLWESMADVVEHHDMPPDDEELQPTDGEREAMLSWYRQFNDSVEARPGVFRARRLSAAEFENTLATLVGFKLQVNVAKAQETVTETSLVDKLFPPDPPGGSGFTNDTASTPLSPVQWNLYSKVIDAAIADLFTPKRRQQLEFYTGPLDGDLTIAHAERLLQTFLPRAHRRPVDAETLSIAMQAVKQGDDLETAMRFEMKAALMSPRFLYRGYLMPAPNGGEGRVDAYEMAERLSYFLWADMPDDALMKAAAAGQLTTDEQITAQVQRMLQDTRARALADVFAVEWLGLVDLESVGSPNPVVRRGIVGQPREFVNYLFTENRPLLELVDSRVTFVNTQLSGYYDPNDRKKMTRTKGRRGVERAFTPLQRLELTHTSYRGGLLTMPGILMMNRGPVARGTWMLERIMGEHLPDPPADVGQVPGNKKGQKLSFRERFEMHRENKTCALCHNKIDPLGFALDGYGGNAHLIKSKTPIDTSGELPTGDKFADFNELKTILVTSQRPTIVRSITERMLSYAVARELTVYDRPELDRIAGEIERTGGGYGDLAALVATSLPFTHTIKEESE